MGSSWCCHEAQSTYFGGGGGKGEPVIVITFDGDRPSGRSVIFVVGFILCGMQFHPWSMGL